MRRSGLAALCSLIFVLATRCAIDDSDRCADEYEFRDGACYEEQSTETNTDTGDSTSDAGPGNVEGWLGTPCSCEGEQCDVFGVPVPAGGPITGCEQVPEDWTGAAKVCLRSYTGDMAADSYFANGFCSLLAAKCVGDELICTSATLGEFDQMVACPANSVMIASSADLVMSGLSATVDSKYCAPSCENNDACRTGEVDPVFGKAPTEYQCVFKDGVGFCFDPRNLSGEYTAQAF